MKILALRVRNLTSLAGEVELDFQAPPLAHAGLFAITGPTGAGKSTLLDALCLALYDRLPRLGHGDDVRTVLRHGAADGFAEVDFIGRDGRSYRARWEVRRARNRADGRLQAQNMALTDLATGAALGGGKRETQDAIADKVGLDYHQFRRSVLLAQNDFDAFLRAKPDDRAGLLELMTGTAIYGELSKAAYDRAKTEEAALKALDDELKRVNVLADDERAALTAEARAAEESTARLAEEVAGLTREIEWYRAADELARRVAEAEALNTAANAAVTAAQPERDRIAQVRRALAIAPQVETADRLARERQRLADEERQAADALAEAEQALTAATQARDAARATEEQAEAAFKAAGPLLDQAADLDSRLSEGHQRLTRCAEAEAAARAQVDQARINAAALAAERQECGATAARLELWLSEHQTYRPLAEQLERWTDVVAAHAQHAATRAQAAERYSQTRRQLTALNAQAEENARRAAAVAEQLTSIDARIVPLTARTNATDAEALEHRRDDLATLEEALTASVDAASALAQLDDRIAECAKRRAAAEQRKAQSQQVLADTAERLAALRAALTEAQAALALAEAAEGEQAKVLRQRLIDGEPCPVCGAREHPVDQAHSALPALLSGLRARVAGIEGERDACMKQQADAQATLRASEETLAHAAADDGQWRRERTQVKTRLANAAGAVASLAQRCAVAQADTHRDTLTAVRTERQHVAERLRAVRVAEADLRTLRAQREELQQQHLGVTDRQARTASERAGLEVEERAARADGEHAAAAMAECADRLADPLAALPKWRDLLGDPAALTARLRAVADEWQQTCASLDRQRDSERALAAKCDSAAAALDNALRNAERETRRRDDERQAVERLAAARSQLFGGEATAEIRTRFNDAFKAGRQQAQQAQEVWAAAAQARSAAQNRVTMLAQAQDNAAQAAAQAAAALAERLAGSDLTEDAVRVAMELGDEWMSAAEARQTALREADAAARAVLAERRQSAAAHAASGRPERAADQLAPLLVERSGEHEQARDLSARLRQRLADDDRNRDAAAETRRLIGEQRQRFDLWKGMADLIGSADGKKFRLFAQGLTLDRLLGLANLHLAELTPRYVLQRAPGADLDLQVIDHDMADEVRAVANLSGGERFLVSLALALGLASMTGSRTLSESLFIDEGFGALDAESLDVAIAALETLHASGRKVGVISHVQAMIDRIGVQVRVARLGGGRSAVQLRTA